MQTANMQDFRRKLGFSDFPIEGKLTIFSLTFAKRVERSTNGARRIYATMRFKFLKIFFKTKTIANLAVNFFSS